MVRDWPSEWIDELDKLARKGLANSVIAYRLNVMFGTDLTRNAIIGKRHRLKIRVKDLELDKQKTLRPAAKPEQVRSIPVLETSPKPAGIKRRISNVTPLHTRRRTRRTDPILPPVTGKPVSLLGRRRDQCGWPINDGDPFLFCGAIKENLKDSYCDYHRRLATRGPIALSGG